MSAYHCTQLSYTTQHRTVPIIFPLILLVRWCNWYSVGLAISRLLVQILLEAMLCNNLGQVVHTYVPVTKQYNLVPAKGGDALWLGR